MSYEIAVRSQSHVLITGPTGSGKSRLAEKIHQEGIRSELPFVSVNLATLHEGLIESELFGHEKGAFTSAMQRRKGKLEEAEGGTVFLDEIGELSPRLQARLLDFVQNRKVILVGGNQERILDVRIIAATQRNLPELIRKGEFRADLYYRLKVVSIEMKSLFERSEEFDSILHSCLAEVCESLGKRVLSISEELACKLESYRWPGNIRELKNILEYAVLNCMDSELSVHQLPDWFNPISSVEDSLAWNASEEKIMLDYGSAIARFEKEYLKGALQKYRGRVNKTAKMIGMSKATLKRRIHAYGLMPKVTYT
jgi:DNA-binding NtrC family response regulator